MRSTQLFGLVGALVLSAGRPSAASSQDFRAADLRVNMQIRVQQSGGEAGSGLFLGILGDTLFYESSTAHPENVSGSSLTYSVVKVPIAEVSRLDVQVGPRPPIARDRCAGVLSGAGCGARIAVEVITDDMRNGRRHSSSDNGYEGVGEAMAAGGLVIGGAVIGLIKSANRHNAASEDSGWRHVRLPKPQTR
jgi:hypothetical protein